MNKKIIKFLETFFITLISAFLSHYFPIAELLTLIESEQLLTIIDVAFYVLLANVFMYLVFYCVKKQIMYIDIKILTGEQENDSISFFEESEDLNDMKAIITFKGRFRKCKKNIHIKCPESLVMQSRKKGNSKHLKEKDNGSVFTLDLNDLIRHSSKSIEVTKVVYFTLLMEEHNLGDEDFLKFERSYNIGNIIIRSEKLKIFFK